MSTANATLTFEPLREALDARLQAEMPEQIERLRWSADRIEQHQRDGLRRLLAHAIERSPFHRRRLAGLDPATFDPADLPSLPVMTKHEMMDRLDDVLTDRRVTAAAAERALGATGSAPVPITERSFAMASGGSSGRRGVFCFDLDAVFDFVASLSRTTHAKLLELGGPPPGGVCVGLVAAPSAVHATGMAPAVTTGPDSAIRFAPVPATLPLGEMVDRLNQVQPHLLYGYASAIARLAGEQRAGRLRLQLLGVTSTSETLLPELRAAIAEGFGAPIVNTFGSTEGLVGISPPDDEVLVFNSDCCIVELVDEQHRPVPDGTPSAKVLLTNLSNRLQPLIRYEIDDRFVRHPAVAEHGHLRATVEGRADDALRYAGGVTVHPIALRSVFVKTPAVAEYQVRQTPTGIDVLAVADAGVDLDPLRTALRGALRESGLADPDVAVTVVDRLDRDPLTGKVRRFQPLR
jgi:phenylacetate-coenzyme A ligase PaaK-like adenylate-forming protein